MLTVGLSNVKQLNIGGVTAHVPAAGEADAQQNKSVTRRIAVHKAAAAQEAY
jgi:hypothetical protein